MNNIQKAFAAKKKIGIRMADGGPVLRMSTELTPQAPSTRPVRSLRDGFNAIVDRIQERGPSLAGAAAPFAKARDDIAAHTNERGYPGQPMQAPMVATNAPAQRFADGGRADMRSGGHMRGAGTGTSDSIPAMLSNGEYVLPADTVKHIGKENLDQIKDATHTPTNMRTENHLADGGYLDRAAGGIRNARNWMAGKLGTGAAPAIPPVAPAAPAAPTLPAAPTPPAPTPVAPAGTALSPGEAIYKNIPNKEYLGAEATPRPTMRAPEVPMDRAARFAAGPQNPFPAPVSNLAKAQNLVSKFNPSATKMQAAGGVLSGAASFAPHWAAFADNSGLDNGQKAKLLLRDTTRAVGGIVGGGVGVGLSAPTGPGAAVGGALGAVGGAMATDWAGGKIREGLNKANEFLGGSKDYISSTDDDLAKAGYDPDALIQIRDPRAPKVAPTPTPTAGQPSAATPTMRNPDPATISPTPFEARNSMRGGLPVADQRGAIPSDGLAAANKDMNSFNGPRLRDPTYKLGGYDTNADIYAQVTNGGKKLNSFTGTGDGSAAAEYEKSDQYQSGIRRAAADKAMLNEMVARREADGGSGQGGVSMLGGQSVFSPIADPSKMTRGDKGREIQREQIAAQTAHQNGIRSDSIANQAANLAEQKRAHNMQGEASMRSNQIAGAKLLMDERKYGADRSDVLETQRGKAKEGRIDSDKAYRDQLKTQHPDVDGVQSPLIAQKMVAMNQAISSRVAQLRKAGRNDDAAALEINGASEVGADESARIDQGIEVMNRFNELQPRWFGASDGETSSNYLDFLPHPSSKGDTVNLGQPDAKGKFARTIPRKHLSRTMIQNYNPFADQGIPTADYLRGQ